MGARAPNPDGAPVGAGAGSGRRLGSGPWGWRRGSTVERWRRGRAAATTEIQGRGHRTQPWGRRPRRERAGVVAVSAWRARGCGRDEWDGEACTGRTRAVAAATSAGRARWCVEQGRPVRVVTGRRAKWAQRGRGGRGLTGVAETRVGEARWSLWGGGRGRRQRRGGGPAKAWRFQRGAPAWWRGREAPAEVGSGALPRSSRGR